MSKLKEVISLFFTRPFRIHLILVILAFFVILYLNLLFLDYYTLHGEEITVPDLKGVDKANLHNILDDKDLNFKIIDSVYIGEEQKGLVIGQNPSPLSKVKKYRTIYLTINSMNPPSVRLPLLTDKSMRQARSIIENIGLKLGELDYQPDQCVNCVLAMRINGVNLKGDTLIPKGTVVSLLLGGGLSEEKVLVPLIINLSRKEAISRLKESFLNLGSEVYDESVLDQEDSSSAKIYVQYPPYGAKSWVYMGSSVDVEYTLLENKIDTNIVILDSSLFSNYGKDTL